MKILAKRLDLILEVSSNCNDSLILWKCDSPDLAQIKYSHLVIQGSAWTYIVRCKNERARWCMVSGSVWAHIETQKGLANHQEMTVGVTEKLAQLAQRGWEGWRFVEEFESCLDTVLCSQLWERWGCRPEWPFQPQTFCGLWLKAFLPVTAAALYLGWLWDLPSGAHVTSLTRLKELGWLCENQAGYRAISDLFNSGMVNF